MLVSGRIHRALREPVKTDYGLEHLERTHFPNTQEIPERVSTTTKSALPRALIEPDVDGVFTVDVEDWFHILDIGGPEPHEWGALPSRVEANFIRLLDLFSEKEVSATCFFLGWVADRFPHLVREAAQRGHEIASHGQSHQLTYTLSRDQFSEDIRHSRETLEDLTGAPILGYRSPGFSMASWFYETLADAGYQYDASLFPAPRGHGGMPGGNRAPHPVVQNGRQILEFPVSVVAVLGKPVCFSGGGYLRLFPYWFIRRMSEKVLGEKRPIVFYIHPREIDPHHPRLKMSAHRRFKSYVNLASTERKVVRILSDFRLTTFRQLLSQDTQNKKLMEA